MLKIILAASEVSEKDEKKYQHSKSSLIKSVFLKTLSIKLRKRGKNRRK